MLRLAQSTNRFDVYFQQKLVFSHRNDDPALTVGTGKSKIKEEEGYFTFKDKIKQHMPMDRFVVKINSDEAIEVHFSNTKAYKTVVLRFEAPRDQAQKKLLTVRLWTEAVGLNRCWLRLPCHQNEDVYGCGEQFSYFCLNEKTVPLWVQEKGVGRAGYQQKLAQLLAKKGGSPFHTYFPQPTFVAFADDILYSCHVETSAYGEIAFHQSGKKQRAHELFFWDIPKRITLQLGESPEEVVGQLSARLGRQPPIPDWAYDGMWLALQGHGGLDNVRARLDKFLDAGVTIGAIWSQDWEGIRTTPLGTRLFWDWKWHGAGRPDRFPNFPDFVKEMRAKGIRYLGYMNTFLSLPGDLYQQVPDKKFFVQTQADTEYVMDVSENDAVIFDLTHPGCFEWVKDIIKQHLIQEAGLSGWMSDYGEYLPTDAKLHSGEDPLLAHNRYPVLFAKATWEAITELGLEEEVTFFSRAGYTGTSRYSPIVWAGDQLVGWDRHDGIPVVLRAALSAGICGIGHHHSDIGGYTTVKWYKRSKELLLRWAELACFSPIMRSHEGLRPEANWQLDSDGETLAHLARMTQVHVMLKPYFQHCEQEYQDQGLPFMRPAVLHYRDDPKTRYIEEEYLLGRDVWVSPVLKEGLTQKVVYLPEDGFIHLWSGVEFKRGTVKIEVPLGYPAVFYRHDSPFLDLFDKIHAKFGIRTM